jgi:hypothetical protein
MRRKDILMSVIEHHLAGLWLILVFRFSFFFFLLQMHLHILHAFIVFFVCVV